MRQKNADGVPAVFSAFVNGDRNHAAHDDAGELEASVGKFDDSCGLDR